MYRYSADGLAEGFMDTTPTPANWLVRHRTALGLSHREAAARMEVDPTTLARWERGEKEPWGKFVDRVNRFLCR